MRTLIHIFLCFSFLRISAAQSSADTLIIDFADQGPEIPQSLYGIFFEEINHAGDGGLYAELIQNRSFEAGVIPVGCQIRNGKLIAPENKPNYLKGIPSNFSMPWDTASLCPGWSLQVSEPSSQAFMELITDTTLHPSAPHVLRISITGASRKNPVQLVNQGYWGINIGRGDNYHLKFYMKVSSGRIGKVTAQLTGYKDIVIASKEFNIVCDGRWHAYSASLKAWGTYSESWLALMFDASCTVCIDHVSLFPEKTFKERENGLRWDVAKMLSGLHPAFMRWPGGCIVEGLTLENRIRWKETIGSSETRPGLFDLWGYHNTTGFGYHEFLQFCEDIGAEGMFVCNAGLSCAYRNGDYCTDEEVQFFIQDALDAIEYAIGVPYSEWGRKRVEHGHPGPFPLKYIEVGNENYGPVYADRFNRFYKAIKEKYPQITIISSIESQNDVPLIESADMIDPHFYRDPEWFFRNTRLFDRMQPRPEYRVYVGEYACNQSVGSGNLYGALSEAAFMTGMERNSDWVRMCSYAPLLENSNARNWPVNLIQVKSNQVLGRSSYFVQRLFSENRPDVNVKINHQVRYTPLSGLFFSGRTGLATWQTHASYKNLKITQNGKILYLSDFNLDVNGWTALSGEWKAGQGMYTQSDLGDRRLSVLDLDLSESYTVEVDAIKIGGSDGFNLIFGLKSPEDYFIYNVGGWGNAQTAIEHISPDGGSMQSEPVPFTVVPDRWYSLKLQVGKNTLRGFVDNNLIVDYTVSEVEKRYIVSGYDREENEIVIKAVNAGSDAWNTELWIQNAGMIDQDGRVITLSSTFGTDENTFDEPKKIVPVTEIRHDFSNRFTMKFKPYSLTVLRIRRI